MSRDALDHHPAPVHDLESTSSTNTLAREALEHGAVDGELFLAAEQTAGRGRIGRSWYSPGARGHLYLSLVLRRPTIPLAQVPQLTLAAGVAMADALATVYGLQTVLKWPNDLLVGRRKLGGILCEGVLGGELVRGVVVGVGVNLRGEASALPPPLDATATTVEEALGRALGDAEPDRYALAAAFVDGLFGLLGRPSQPARELEAALAQVRAAWRQRANLPARVALDDGRDGTARELDAHGRLVVELDAGGQVAVESGELTWL